MTTTPTPKPMPELPRPGQEVRWRNPQEARACGWEDVFGPGPYAVARIVDNSAYGLAAGLVLFSTTGRESAHSFEESHR